MFDGAFLRQAPLHREGTSNSISTDDVFYGSGLLLQTGSQFRYTTPYQRHAMRVELAEPSPAELLLRKNARACGLWALCPRFFLWGTTPREGEVYQLSTRDAVLITLTIASLHLGPQVGFHLPAAMAIHLDLSPFRFGLIMAAAAAGSLVGAPATAALLERYGQVNSPVSPWLAFLGLLLSMAGAVLFSSVHDFPSQLAARFLVGLGDSVIPCIQAMLARSMGFCPDLLIAMSALSQAVSLLFAATTLAVAPIVYNTFGLHTSLLGGAVLSSGVSLLALAGFSVWARANDANLERDPDKTEEVLQQLGMEDAEPPNMCYLTKQWWVQLLSVALIYPVILTLADILPYVLYMYGDTHPKDASTTTACLLFTAAVATMASMGIDTMAGRGWLQLCLGIGSAALLEALTQKGMWNSTPALAMTLSASGLTLKAMESAGMGLLGLLLPTGWDLLGFSLVHVAKNGMLALMVAAAGYTLEGVHGIPESQNGILPMMVAVAVAAVLAAALCALDGRDGVTSHNMCEGTLKKEREEREMKHIRWPVGGNIVVPNKIRQSHCAVWLTDSHQPDCLQCHARFSLSTRRHHCRSCGMMFCARCTSHRVPVPQLGYMCYVRVCSTCYIKCLEEQNTPLSIPIRPPSQPPTRQVTCDSSTSDPVGITPYHLDPISRLPMAQYIDFSELRADTWIELAQGSFGKVYKCEFDRVLEQVAVKELRESSEGGRDHNELERITAFVDEICYLNQLRYEHILPFYGWSRHENRLFMVTALCEPGGLAARLRRSTLSYLEYLDIAIRVARAVLFIHSRNIVHQDIAARNILLTASGDAKLADLGLCTPCGSNAPIIPVLWAPPEALIVTNKQRVAHRSFDVWSFGVLLWEMLNVPHQCPYFWLLPDVDFDKNAFLRRAAEEIKAANLLPCPPHRPYAQTIWTELVLQCWVINPRERPNMRKVVDTLRVLLDKARSDPDTNACSSASPTQPLPQTTAPTPVAAQETLEAEEQGYLGSTVHGGSPLLATPVNGTNAATIMAGGTGYYITDS